MLGRLAFVSTFSLTRSVAFWCQGWSASISFCFFATGPPLYHGVSCWRRQGPGRANAWRRWRWLSCLTVSRCVSAHLRWAGGGWWWLFLRRGGGRGGLQLNRARIHSPSWLTVSSALVRCMETAYRPMFCSLPFSCICHSRMIMSLVPMLAPRLYWLSGVFSQDFTCDGE